MEARDGDGLRYARARPVHRETEIFYLFTLERGAIGWINREVMKDGTPAQMKRRQIRPANLPEYSEKKSANSYPSGGATLAEPLPNNPKHVTAK
jgi:hypothetical protein